MCGGGVKLQSGVMSTTIIVVTFNIKIGDTTTTTTTTTTTITIVTTINTTITITTITTTILTTTIITTTSVCARMMLVCMSLCVHVSIYQLIRLSICR